MTKKQAKKLVQKTTLKESKVNIKPLGDRVLIKPEEEKLEKTPSGIIIPDTAKKEKPGRGTVVATGPGKISDDGKVLPVSIKVGDKVYFSPGWDNEIEIGDEKYYLVHESDIKGITK